MFTADDVINIIQDLPDDKNNPLSDEYSCIYNDFDGNHCIAGEVLFKLGLDIPEPGSPENDKNVAQVIYSLGYREKFSDEAVDILSTAQFYADKYTHNPFTAEGCYSWELAKIEAVNRYNEIKESS